MRALLFRKIVVEGVNYYQLFDYVTDFTADEEYGDYSSRATHDYFYFDQDSDVVIPDASLLNIYCDSDDNTLKVVDNSDLYDEISRKFNDKFHYFDDDIKVDYIIDSVCDKVQFQNAAVANLVEQIYLNKAIVESELPEEIKMGQKNNILFYGNVGSGKNTVINALKEEIDIPYADVKLSTDVDETLEKIMNQLIENSNSDEEASHGVVFIRDNFNDLIYELGEEAYDCINFITTQGVTEYNGHVIDFRTVTFVVLKNEYYNTKDSDMLEFECAANCTCRIKTRDYSPADKYEILFGENGRLYQYEKFLKAKGKKLIVDEMSLRNIITLCSTVDPNMIFLNGLIDAIIKLSITNGVKDVRIDDKTVEMVMEQLLPALSTHPAVKANSTIRKEEKNDEEDFWFEKKVDAIVDEVKKYVVGQDEAVRLIVHQLVKNIHWANKKDVENPKDYIKNILIRGNPGTGKTFITGLILKNLGVPYYVADATEYTEAGYVGKDVDDMLVGLYHAAGDNLAKAQTGIIDIDEIDKIARKGGVGRDVGGSGVQEALYKFAEGTTIRINVGTRMNEQPIYFDTSRLTVICSGAFEGIEKLRDERVGKKKVGFGNQDVKKSDAAIADVDYINYGMNSQFMRRVKQVIELKDVSKEQFIDIMKTSKSSALRVEQETLREQGIEVEYTEDFYSALADKALLMKQGVTGIEKALLKVFQSINIQDIRSSKIKKIILSADVIKDPDKVVLIERDKVKSIGIK